MRTSLILAGILTCLATAPAGAQPAPDAPAADPAKARNRNLAAKLAGLVGFANTACPDVRGDPDLLKAAVRRMGIEPADLDTGELAMTARAYIETYRQDVSANCARAFETFGPSSVLVPNLVVRR